MKLYIQVALLFLILSSFGTPADASKQGDAAGDAEAIATLVKQLEAANNRGDVEGWVSLFAENFVYMGPGAPAVSSRNELLEVARTGFRNRASIEIVPVEIQTCGAWAFSRNDVTGKVKLHGSGEEVKVDVKEIAIYKRDEQGRWRISRLIINSNT